MHVCCLLPRYSGPETHDSEGSATADLETRLKKEQSSVGVEHLICRAPSAPSGTGSLSHSEEFRNHPRTLTPHPRGLVQASARTPFTAALCGTTLEPARTANELIGRTNYPGNKRRRDGKGRDIGLEEQKSGGARNETAEETSKENLKWRG